MKDMTTAAATTARQIKGITNANREHSQVATTVLQDLSELRRVTDRNAAGVRQTRANTAELLRSAEALAAAVDGSKKPH
jgi:methyl-accepting chemotaxis protein